MLEKMDRKKKLGESKGSYDDFDFDSKEPVYNNRQRTDVGRRSGSIRVIQDSRQKTNSDRKHKIAGNRKKTTARKSGRNSNGKNNNSDSFIAQNKRVFIFGGIGLIAAIVIFFGVALSHVREGRVMDNVYIAGMNVSGLTYEQTLAAVNASNLFQDSEVKLTDGKKEFTINGADIGLSALPEQTVQKAMNYCKEGNIISRAFAAASLMFIPHDIIPAPQVDEARLTEKLNECGVLMKGERKDHYFELTKDLVATFYPGTTGYNGDCSVALAQVKDALSKEKFRNIRVDFTAAPPDALTVEKAGEMIHADPEDAHYAYNGNEVTIVPDINGREIDKEAAAPLVGKVVEGAEPVDIPYTASYAKVNAKTLKEKLFADTLATYSTNYSGSTENRSLNVDRAAKLISGTVVPPGNIFSFNDTVGARTKENGFYTAKEYIDGQSVDGIGGGVCQVASTLYSAVLYADMGIVERINHMMPVGYIPLGQDATVTDSGIDFQFENTSSYPIKISAYTNGTNITVAVLGTAWDPARKIEIINDESSSNGNIVIKSKRNVYENGELTQTDTLRSSTYTPHE